MLFFEARVRRFGSGSAGLSGAPEIAGPPARAAVNAIALTAIETPRFAKIVSMAGGASNRLAFEVTVALASRV